MTIHVTPQVNFDLFMSINLSLYPCFQSQPSCSYASFETNSSSASIGLICQVFEAPNCIMHGLILF